MRNLMLAIALLSGCATASKDFGGLSPGMTKAQVIERLGEPASISKDVSGEILIYSLANFPQHEFVILRDGKVFRFFREDPR